jgi:hypothetical protein
MWATRRTKILQHITAPEIHAAAIAKNLMKSIIILPPHQPSTNQPPALIFSEISAETHAQLLRSSNEHHAPYRFDMLRWLELRDQ